MLKVTQQVPEVSFKPLQTPWAFLLSALLGKLRGLGRLSSSNHRHLWAGPGGRGARSQTQNAHCDGSGAGESH